MVSNFEASLINITTGIIAPMLINSPAAAKKPMTIKIVNLSFSFFNIFQINEFKIIYQMPFVSIMKFLSKLTLNLNCSWSTRTK